MNDAKKFSELSRGRQAGIVIGAVVQMALAVWAFVDLGRRAPSEVRGRKALWIPVILVNWIGPAAYFLVGRKR